MAYRTMNINDKFTYNGKYYFIDSWDDDDGIVIKVVNSESMQHKWHSDPILNYIFSNGSGMVLRPFVSSEIDAAILTYVQHGGFAGLTPVEYLHSLGLVE